MLAWSGNVDDQMIHSVRVDPDNKMNEETKRLVFGFNDSELRSF